MINNMMNNNNQKEFNDFDEMIEFLEDIKASTKIEDKSLKDLVFIANGKDLALHLPNKTGGIDEVQVRSCAWNSLLQRLGIKGPAFAYESYIGMEAKTMILNTAVTEMNGTSSPWKFQLITQKDAVNAFMSEKYVMIPIADVFSAFYNKIAEIYQKLEFNFHGSWDWLLSFADFEVDQIEMNSKKYQLHLTVDSSDIGESAIRIGAYVKGDNHGSSRSVPIMNDFNIIHTGYASMSTVETHLNGLEAAISDKARKVQELMNINIVPSWAKLEAIFKKVGLPIKKIRQQLILDDCQTAWDIVQELSLIVTDPEDRDKEIRAQSDLLKLFNAQYWTSVIK